MDTTPYTFTWHPIERVLEIALTGLWAQADVAPYYQALMEFAGAHVTSSFMVLTDLRKYPVQHPEVADMHAAKLAEVQQNSPVVREAWVVAGVVAKMQATRGAESGVQEINMFTDRDAAWAYLTSTVAA